MEYRVNRFPFFYSYYSAYETLTDEADKVRFIDALMKYAFFGEETKLPENLAGMFELAKPNIDKSVKNTLQGSANGRKGGAPNGNQNARKKKSDTDETTQGLNGNKADREKKKEMEHGNNKRDNSVSAEGTVEKGNIDFAKIAG